jgi:micrococcal nuclease
MLFVLVLSAVLLARGRSDGGQAAAGERPGAVLSGRVTRVVDGDTVHVDLGGRDETVRYIGMDTPESVKPGVPVQCFAEAASHRNTALVAGRDVTLRLDAETRDRYGRLLAYVYRRSDGLFVNAELVRHGYARLLTIPPNVAHETELAGLADRAQAEGLGLWRAC